MDAKTKKLRQQEVLDRRAVQEGLRAMEAFSPSRVPCSCGSLHCWIGAHVMEQRTEFDRLALRDRIVAGEVTSWRSTLEWLSRTTIHWFWRGSYLERVEPAETTERVAVPVTVGWQDVVAGVLSLEKGVRAPPPQAVLDRTQADSAAYGRALSPERRPFYGYRAPAPQRDLAYFQKQSAARLLRAQGVAVHVPASNINVDALRAHAVKRQA